MFLLYIQWRLKAQEAAVQVLQLGCGSHTQRWRFHRGLVHSGFGSAFEAQLRMPETVCLCAASLPMPAVAQRRARTLMVAAPQPWLWREFEKEVGTARSCRPGDPDGRRCSSRAGESSPRTTRGRRRPTGASRAETSATPSSNLPGTRGSGCATTWMRGSIAATSPHPQHRRLLRPRAGNADRVLHFVERPDEEGSYRTISLTALRSQTARRKAPLSCSAVPRPQLRSHRASALSARL